MKYLSLFSGIGGFDLALNNNKHECVGYSEIDKYAIQVYKFRFGDNIKNYGNAREINTEELPNFDILVGGFPCQAFSIAGKRGGFEDTRGTLFFEIARIAKAKKPKIILLENVKGLLNHQKGNTFRIILQTLWELGYSSLQWTIFNSKHFGVPQNRERVFIIGYLREESRRQILPFREDAEEVSGVSKEKIQCGTITQAFGRYGCSKEELRMYEATYKAHRANEIREHKGSPTLTQNMGTGGHNVPMVMNTQNRDINRPAIKKRIEAGLKPNAGSGTIGKEDEAYCLDAGNNQGVARCLDSNMHKGVTPKFHYEKKKRNIVNDYDKLRRLTPIECERLQGFPDDWTRFGINEDNKMTIISDTQRYRQLGNAVTVNVVDWIVKRL